MRGPPIPVEVGDPLDGPHREAYWSALRTGRRSGRFLWRAGNTRAGQHVTGENVSSVAGLTGDPGPSPMGRVDRTEPAPVVEDQHLRVVVIAVPIDPAEHEDDAAEEV